MKFKKSIYLAVATGWTISIAVLSLISLSGTPAIQSPVSDKVVHTVFYLIFVLVWYLYLKDRKIKNIILKIFLLSISYGTIVEVLQDMMPFNRKFDIKDILANTIGSLIAVILLKLYLIRFKIALKKRN